MLLVQITRIFNFMKNPHKVRNSKRVADFNSNTKDGGDRVLSSTWRVPPHGFMGILSVASYMVFYQNSSRDHCS